MLNPTQLAERLLSSGIATPGQIAGCSDADISMRQGEQFMFFIADGSSEDPPVYYYFEGRGEFKKAANSLWAVVEAEVEMLERLRREYPESPFRP
jgi:hypothetical protein